MIFPSLTGDVRILVVVLLTTPAWPKIFLNRLKMKTKIWNLLHDGIIEKIEGAIPGDLLVTVEIKWIKQLFSRGNDCFYLKLTNCTLLEFYPFDKDILITNIQSILKYELWNASCEEEGDMIILYCSTGILKLKYDTSVAYLDKTTVITEQEIIAKLDSDRSWENS